LQVRILPGPPFSLPFDRQVCMKPKFGHFGQTLMIGSQRLA